MSDPWNDDELLARLAAALTAADAVPRSFTEAGRRAFDWRDIDSELADLAFDSEVHGLDETAHTRSELASLRALTYTAHRSELTIELAISRGVLQGQLAPAQVGEIRIKTMSGKVTELATDEVGYFAVHPVPAEPFRLHCRTASGVSVSTNWIQL